MTLTRRRTRCDNVARIRCGRTRIRLHPHLVKAGGRARNAEMAQGQGHGKASQRGRVFPDVRRRRAAGGGGRHARPRPTPASSRISASARRSRCSRSNRCRSGARSSACSTTPMPSPPVRPMASVNRCSATHRVTARGARRCSADVLICPQVAPTIRRLACRRATTRCCRASWFTRSTTTRSRASRRDA